MAENARAAAEWRLIEKAWKDDGFRKSLIADPKAAVSAELGVSLPASTTVRVVEETPDTFVLVIPARGDAAPASHLSGGELERVAGGGWTSPDTYGTCGCTTRPPCG